MSGFLHSLLNTFLHNQNQFASGGLLLMAVGSILAMMKSIPAKIWEWIIHQTTISLIVTDDNFEFEWLKKWLEEQPIMRKARHIDVGTGDGRKWWKSAPTGTVVSPAPGHHWMWHNGRPLSVTVTRLEDSKSGERKESIKFTTIGRDQRFFRGLIAAIENYHKTTVEKPEPRLYIWRKDDWCRLTPYYPRPLNTVILPENLKEELVRDIDDFKNSRDWYVGMGIPYHKGYLFDGPPGTGKTSTVIGLSSEYNARVYILKVGEMSDSTLVDAVTKIAANSFIVMEDIDCVDAAAKREDSKTDDGKDKKKDLKDLLGVSLSGLLNVLDGMLAPSGTMFFMTTNHADKLDPALIRPGRVDFKRHLGLATEYQKKELYKRFFPGKDATGDFLRANGSMAELQQVLMNERANAQVAKEK